jgi:1,6-anhydro-N-acetylmuramate kinase
LADTEGLRAHPPAISENLEQEGLGASMIEPPRRSALDRPLETLSWDGATIKKYRHGGSGHENVLTTEVLTALDFLPRSFLSEVLRSAHGDQRTLELVASEAEQADITVLGDDVFLRPSGVSHGDRMTLQPDAVIEMPGTYVLVEAKRIRSPAEFGLDQLAKSLAVAVTQAAGRRPLLLVVMGAAPPIRLRGGGGRELSIQDSIAEHLPRIAAGSDFDLDPELMLASVPQTVAWITWDEKCDLARRNLRRYDGMPVEIRSSIERLVDAVVSVVDRHR